MHSGSETKPSSSRSDLCVSAIVLAQSFAPICGDKPHVLILGTMPGKISLAQQQYYAHPQNAFWRILGELIHFDAKGDYAARIESVKNAQMALWDVLKLCVRTSSLDADIEADSEVPNEIAQLLTTHHTIRRVCFNGGKAAQLYRRHIIPQLPENFRALEYCQLPSTSPAHAGMRYAEKLKAWRVVLD